MIEEDNKLNSTIDQPAPVAPDSPDAEAAFALDEDDDDMRLQSVELDQEEVPETDIIFECPHCEKALSIDPRGAGLVIRCTQCGQPVTVPIPEGLEIDDFDATPEELSIQLLSARQHLAKAQAHTHEIEAELASLRAFHESAVTQAAEQARLRDRIRSRLSEAARLQADANGIIRDVAAMLTASD